MEAAIAVKTSRLQQQQKDQGANLNDFMESRRPLKKSWSISSTSVAQQFVRKAHQAPRRTESTPSYYAPVGNTREAQDAAKAAQLQRQRIEQESKQLESSISAGRRQKIKIVVVKKKKSGPVKVDPAKAAQLQLEEEIRQMEAAIATAKQQQKKKRMPRSSGLSPNDEAAVSEYKKMEKLGLPEIAIYNCMIRDGVSRQVQKAVLGANHHLLCPPQTSQKRPSTTKPQRATPRPTRPPATTTDPFAQFHQMKKLGLLEAAIRHAMVKAGFERLRKMSFSWANLSTRLLQQNVWYARSDERNGPNP